MATSFSVNQNNWFCLKLVASPEYVYVRAQLLESKLRGYNSNSNETIKYEGIFDEDLDKLTEAADLLIRVTEERDFILQVSC